jgi:hypothetical protein
MHLAGTRPLRGLIIAFLTVLGVAAIAIASTITSAVTLAATALIVPGTGEPDPDAIANLETNAVKYYIVPGTTGHTAPCPADSCSPIGIPYYAQFWPIPIPGWGGLSGQKWNVSVGSGVTNLEKELAALQTDPSAGDITIFGYSQGASVSSIEKTKLATSLTPEEKTHYSFVFIGNPERPNGGIFERLAFLGTVPILDATFGLPSSTTAGIQTTDIAFQYDGVADFPQYPINLLADLNALAGFAYVHPSYLTPDGAATSPSSTELPDSYTEAELLAAQANPANRVQVGDTLYITIPTRTLPILNPLIALGQATGTSALVTPVVDLISPALRVLIDTGYDPNANPGVPTPFKLIPPINPVKLAGDLATATVQGVQTALADLGGAQSPIPSHPVPLIPPILTVTAPSNTTSERAAKSTLKAAPTVDTATASTAVPAHTPGLRTTKTSAAPSDSARPVKAKQAAAKRAARE